VIDPIDGTFNYERGMRLCAFELALVVDARPVVGVIDLPLIGVLSFTSPLLVFLYPVVFAFALVFPPRITWAYAAVVLVGYSAHFLLSPEAADLKVLVERLITLGAMAGLGTLYWRLVRDARGAREEQPRLAVAGVG
jgi:hypothetical protein